jgi:hydroxymethylglutaryl-CoA lyase
MSEHVKIIECPRDAWQGLHTQIPTEVKVAYLKSLISAGFTHIDAVSFVSPSAVPQMADSEKVLESLAPPNHIEIIGIVVNRQGAERAISTRAVTTLGFPYSISAEFLKRNQNQTPGESLHILKEITALTYETGLGVVAYVSMAFGNPYNDVWHIEDVTNTCDQLVASGVQCISLADTVGRATSTQIAEVFATASSQFPAVELGIHLHARPGDVAANVQAAYEAGCRRFDSALGGLGGCPFAQDTLVGNIPTEVLTGVLASLGARVPELMLSQSLLNANEEIGRRFGL